VLWLLKLKFPNLSSGYILFILDAVVVSIAALLFKDLQSILYSAIAIFSYTRVLDTVLGSSDRANLAIIVTSMQGEVADKIIEVLKRGVTVLDGRGWFTKESKQVIMCVIDRSQVYLLKKTVHETDGGAFIILTDAKEVIGVGFKRLVE
jgi:uncharacterized membrane-anchored protein YitT (DUF2179 family)